MRPQASRSILMLTIGAVLTTCVPSSDVHAIGRRRRPRAPTPIPAPAPPPVPMDDAVVVRHTLMDDLTLGDTVHVDVEMRNTGTSAWTHPEFKLGSVGDAAGEAARLMAGGDPHRSWLPPGTRVEPGSSHVFTFPLRGATEGAYRPAWRMVHEGVRWFGESASHDVTVRQSVTRLPSRDTIRRFRGDFLAIGEFTRPAFFYPGWSPDERRRFRAEYHARGYTHVPFSPFNSYPMNPDWTYDYRNDVAGFRAILEELLDDGLIPVVFLFAGDYGADQWSIEQVEAYYSRYVPAIADLVGAFVPAWEMNDINAWWGVGVNQTRLVSHLRGLVGPDKLIYVHFTPERWSGRPDFSRTDPNGDQREWWRRTDADGLLYQEHPNRDEDDVIRRTRGIAWRIVHDIGDQRERDFVFFEYARTEALGIRLGTRAMQDPNVIGFCNGGPSSSPNRSPNPNPHGADEIDLSQVTWLHTDVSSWRVTSTVTSVSVTPDEICVNHTAAGLWPFSTDVFPVGPGDPPGGAPIEGNIWIFAQFNGRWYAATWDWLRPGQQCKHETAETLGRDQIRFPPMDASWVPQPGDRVGFMMSTIARTNLRAGEERSNVVQFTWPY